MSDFGTMKSRISRDLNRGGELTAVASDEIKTAILHYERERFWFLEQRATIATVASQEFYGLPGDFQDDDSLVIAVNDNTYPLHKRSYRQLEDWFVKSATFTGPPTDFAIYDEQIRLYPVPNAAYTMTLSYYKSTTALSDNADTNEWMVEGEELIRARAAKMMCATRVRDHELAGIYQLAESEAAKAFRRITDTRLATGRTRKRR